MATLNQSNPNLQILNALVGLMGNKYAAQSPVGVGASMAPSMIPSTTVNPVGMGSAVLAKILGGGSVAEASPQQPGQSTFDQMEIDANKKAAEQAIKKEAEANVNALGPQKVLEEISKVAPTATEEDTPAQSTPQAPSATPQGAGFLDNLDTAMGGIGKALSSILTLGGSLKSPNYASNELALEQAKTLKQEREVGMTAAKREEATAVTEKEKTKQREDFFKKILQPEPMSGEADKSFGFAERTVNAINGVYDIIGEKDESGSITGLDVNKLKLARPGSEMKQKLEFLRNEVVNAILRKESGAAINKEDIKMANKLTGLNFNLGALFKNPEALKSGLDTLQTANKRSLSRLQPNSQIQGVVKGLLAKGYSKEQIYGILEQEGQI